MERHFTGREAVRDVVIGMSDGLTVPFALAAGLTGAVTATRVIVTAGLAEIAAGSIAMGLGGFLAARSDVEHYNSEQRREAREVQEKPEEEAAEVVEVLRRYGLREEESRPIVDALRTRPEAWVDFMMRYELNLEKQDPHRALTSALTIAGAYVVGGFIPLTAYIVLKNVTEALTVSASVTLVALAVFGYIKGRFTGAPPLKSAGQTTLVGGLAAGAAFLIARAVS